MPETQKKVLVVTHSPGGESDDSVDELTTHLNDGWRLVTTSAMGGVGGYSGPVQFAALVVLERQDRRTVGGFASV